MSYHIEVLFLFIMLFRMSVSSRHCVKISRNRYLSFKRRIYEQDVNRGLNLLNKLIIPSMVTSTNVPILKLAIKVRKTLKHYKKLDNESLAHIKHIFDWACRTEKYGITKDLIEIVIDTNIYSVDYCKFLSFSLARSIMSDNLELVKYVIDKGADVHLTDETGIYPIYRATSASTTLTKFLLLEQGVNLNTSSNGKYPIMSAIYNNNYDLIEIFVQNGASLNVYSDGKYPLELAIIRCDYKTVQFLVRNGCDPDMGLCIACFEDNLSIVKLLVESGANLNKTNRNDEYPLMCANNIEVVKYLIDKGANIDIENVNSVTALIDSIVKENVDKVNYLVEKGVDINYRTKSGILPLYVAWNKMWKSLSLDYELEDCILKTLVENGANINVPLSNGGKTLFQLACIDCIGHWMYLIDYLYKKGGNPYIRDSNGKNSITLALEKHGESKNRIIKESLKYMLNTYVN
eukprot:TRINITY_DN12520_c0_g1_i1.p1 TRINITY_DN12520_c0_g1~~TRINITY_DN12520_c0_g1_i1.p1  ORF type:complete len:461 (-),score=44.73 TRINITY_DN12520_c0_g1_i1:70-1452(-)